MADPTFRRALPAELLEDVQKYELNPGCQCNMPIYRRVASVAHAQLIAYLSGRASAPVVTQADNWTVINCTAGQLEARLRQLPPGRKSLAVARYEDQVTVIVNELDA